MLVHALLAVAEAARERLVLLLGDPDYPPRLLATADPPLLLYVQGRAELLAAPSVAVVGSRNPTPQGAADARRFACGFAQAGWIAPSEIQLLSSLAGRRGWRAAVRRRSGRAVEKAVRGMLPKTTLGRAQLKKLKVYAGPEHPHQAQQPVPFEITQVAQ